MSAGVAVEALTLTLGAFRLGKIDLAVAPGEILVILGPNGAGKSVTLETIAGFHRPEGGSVLIGGRDATALPPERRHVGFVVQNFGLFPHLSVARNVAIARRRGRAKAALSVAMPQLDDTAALLRYFGIAHLAARTPADLSPGEKQRVALARALAGAPDLFLFDEPFSALDAQTRGELRDELQTFLRALPIPAIFVTHDRSDATTLADRVVLLRDGAVVQSGTAAQVFRRPVNSFVARFVGVENVLSGRVVGTVGDIASVEIGRHILHAAEPAEPFPPGTSVVLGIRAEDAKVSALPAKAVPSLIVNEFNGRISALRHEGALAVVTVDCGFPLHAYLLAPQAREMGLAPERQVTVEIAPGAIHLMRE